MNILPLRKIEINSRKPVESFLADLRKSCIVRNGFEKSTENLLGVVEGNRFKMSRDIAYRNSFLPVAIGRVVGNNDEITISVLMRPPMYSLVFFGFWISILVAISVLIVLKGHIGSPLFVTSILMAFGYGVVQTCFWLEAPKLERILMHVAKS